MTAKEQSVGVRSDGLSKSTRGADDPLKIAAAIVNTPYPAHQLTRDPTAWDVYMAGYAAGCGAGHTEGYERGYLDGFRASEASMGRHWTLIAERIRRMRNAPTHAELVQRRAG